uniref:Innexin n=1 Tax=Macrostomum lignano TaxID=282301 RepID=A0A1I8FMN6_9PLAT
SSKACIDRGPGKSSQCPLPACGSPKQHRASNELMRFPPSADSAIGSLIGQYLWARKSNLTITAAHLLFSANRWEFRPHILDTLASGVNIVCRTPEVGLPAASDLKILSLSVSPRRRQVAAASRAERYEVADFQRRVGAGLRQTDAAGGPGGRLLPCLALTINGRRRLRRGCSSSWPRPLRCRLDCPPSSAGLARLACGSRAALRWPEAARGLTVAGSQPVSGFKFTSRKQPSIRRWTPWTGSTPTMPPVLIVIMSSIVMTKTVPPGDPVQCWIPPEFKPAWEQYAETYCWAEEHLLCAAERQHSRRRDGSGEELKYYQWVPFVLAIQGTHVPLAGGDLEADETGRSGEARGQDQEAGLVLSKRHREEDRKQSGFFYNLKKVLIRYLLIGRAAYGRYLINSTCTSLSSCVYIANVVGQFFLPQRFPRPPITTFMGSASCATCGTITTGGTADTSPGVTLCDFNVRVIGNSHPRTLQCVLILRLPLVHAAVRSPPLVTILDALFWLAWASYQTGRFATLRRLLESAPVCQETPPQMLNLRTCTSSSAVDLEQFFNDYIDSDGAFLLRDDWAKMLGEPGAQELLQRLWADYRAPLMNRAAAKGRSKRLQ